MGISQRLVCIEAAGQHDHRHPVLFGIGHHIDRVHQAGANGGHQNGWRTVHMMHGLGHEAAGVFVFDEVERDASLFKRINDSQHLAPRHPERVPAAGLIEPARHKIGCSEL